MKTLVINGSARANGHTSQMIKLFLENLGGEYEIIDAYRVNVAPCKDCRYCWHKKGCSIKDDMQEIYKKLEEADNLILASPMYFHSVTGKMKTLLDRFQIYWAGHVMRHDVPETPVRKGAILMVGGAPGFSTQFLGGELVLKNVLKDVCTECLGEVCLPNSDHDSLETRPDIAQQVIELAKKLKEANEDSSSKGDDHMQGYTYTQNEHYPVEHLVFTTAPEYVKEFLEADHEIWTLGEANTPGLDHIPFLYKEVWLNDNKPGEMHFIFVWESMESWKKSGEKNFQNLLTSRFDAKFNHPYQLTRAIHNEENFGIHRFSRFERI